MERHQILEPVGTHGVVRVDHADDLGVRRGVREREPQRARLVAGKRLRIDELEARAERGAVILDRPPVGRIGGVVDDDDAFVVRVVEARHGIERLLEHLRRFHAGRDMDRHLRCVVRCRRRGGKEAHRRASEQHRGDLLDARERDEDEWHQQQQAQDQRERRAGHEVMPVPVIEHGRGPGADHVRGGAEQQQLREGRARDGEDRQREQEADRDRDAGDLPVVRPVDRTDPGEFRLARGVEHAPVAANAALADLPRLIERFDDVVVDAEGVGARHEIAQHHRLFEAAGLGCAVVVAGARPAELGDHDALAGMEPAQLVVGADGVVDRLLIGLVVPVRQDMSADEVDRRCKLRIVAPDVPGLAGRHRHVGLLLDPLDDLAELLDVPFRLEVLDRALEFRGVGLELGLGLRLDLRERRLEFGWRALLVGRVGQGTLEQRAPQGRFVADHDGGDVVIRARQLDRAADFRLVAVEVGDRLVVGVARQGVVAVAVEVGVEPDAERHPQTELGGDARNDLHAAGRPVEPDRAGVGRDGLQVGADLRRGRNVIGSADAFERRVRDAGERLSDVRRGPFTLQKCP